MATATLPSSGERHSSGDSTVTTQDDSCAVTLACGVSAARFTAPRYRNSLAFHFPFIILRRSCHVFRPCCLSCVDIQRSLQETRPRTTFTELRDRGSLPELVYMYDTVVRASSLAVRATCTVRNVHAPLYINSHQTSVVIASYDRVLRVVSSQTHTSNELRGPQADILAAFSVFAHSRLTAGDSQAPLS